MIHKITRFNWLILVLLWAISTGSFAAGQYVKGLLWKVEATNAAHSEASYILGTMHTEDRRVLDIPAPVSAALKSASSYTMELKLDETVAKQMIALMIYDDGHDLKKILGDSLYSRVSVLMAEYGTPQNVLRGMKPWAVTVTLSTPRPVTGVFLDKYLLDQAVSQGKQIHGLETVNEQLSIFNDMSLGDQVALLKDTVDYHAELSGVYEDMTQLYLKRDLAGLVKLNEKYLKKGSVEVTKRLMTRLIDERNRRMVERMAARLQEGSAFIAIGALHLPGKDGVLNLLQKSGYKISVVY